MKNMYTIADEDLDNLIVVREAVAGKTPKMFVFNSETEKVSTLEADLVLRMKAHSRNISYSEARMTAFTLGTMINSPDHHPVVATTTSDGVPIIGFNSYDQGF